MDGQGHALGEYSGLNVSLDAIGVTHDAEQRRQRHVAVHQRFRLIALEPVGVVGVALEVAPLKQRPINAVQVCRSS
jgi:hypothetical protein